MVRAIKVGDNVRILTKSLPELEEDSRKRLKQYQIVKVTALDVDGSAQFTSVKTVRKQVNVPTEGLELVRSTDLSLSDVVDSIIDGTFKEGATIEVHGELFKVYKDVDGLGLKQETTIDDSDDLLNIPSRYLNRSYIAPLRDEKIQLSLEDLSLRFGSEVEITD